MRIGLLGGTFNPVHLGHLRAAQEVKEAFDLDQIVLIPSAVPPHKNSEGVADAADRIEMLHLAIENQPDFVISDVEFKRQGPSYTIDTIRYFRSRLPETTEFYFILGEDAFLELETWKSYVELLKLVPFIVMARPGKWGENHSKRWAILEAYLKSRISKEYKISAPNSCFVHPTMQPVYIIASTALDISSTQIRALVKNGKSIKYLVPDKVEEYIKSKGLYL